MFAENIGLLYNNIFTSHVNRIIEGEDNSANILPTLFNMMDILNADRKTGKYKNVDYFNGPLFEKKPEIVLKITRLKCFMIYVSMIGVK